MSIHKTGPTPPSPPPWLFLVQEKVESLSYGTVEVIVHEKKVTQIERTEKIRVDSAAAETLRRQEYY